MVSKSLCVCFVYYCICLETLPPSTPNTHTTLHSICGVRKNVGASGSCWFLSHRHLKRLRSHLAPPLKGPPALTPQTNVLTSVTQLLTLLSQQIFHNGQLLTRVSGLPINHLQGFTRFTSIITSISQIHIFFSEPHQKSPKPCGLPCPLLGFLQSCQTHQQYTISSYIYHQPIHQHCSENLACHPATLQLFPDFCMNQASKEKEHGINQRTHQLPPHVSHLFSHSPQEIARVTEL